VVELDPFEPQSVPVKRGALGRLGARDVAAAQAADGRAVVFMADGHEGGLLWRFISDGPAAEPNALDQGALYAARFGAGGLRWIALPADAEPYAAAVARGANSLGRPVALALDPKGNVGAACTARTNFKYAVARGEKAAEMVQAKEVPPDA